MAQIQTLICRQNETAHFSIRHLYQCLQMGLKSLH